MTQHFAACAQADGSVPVPPDGFTLAQVGDRTVVSGELRSDAAETVAQAIARFTPPGAKADDTTPAERRVAALVRICEIAVKHGTDAEGARPLVSFAAHADRAQRRGVTTGAFTGVIDPRDRARILCDASLSRVVMSAEGLPLDVGRASPTWPAAIRRAIIARDHRCRWPGCEIPPAWCDAHHFEHWEHGGRTAVDNGLLLCRQHHTFLHRHPDWTFTFEQQQFRTYRPDGRELHRDPWAAAGTASVRLAV